MTTNINQFGPREVLTRGPDASEGRRTCRPQLEPNAFPGAFEGNVFRAHFSSLAADDLRAAMASLGVPNPCESRSVDARQEIDLKLGVAFSRFQTAYLRRHFPQCGAAHSKARAPSA